MCRVDDETLGTRIRKLREERRLSLARAVEGHFSRAFLHQVEHGQSQPSIGVLRLIARRLDASLDYLVEGEPHFVRRELVLERARLALARDEPERALELVESVGPTQAWPLRSDLQLCAAEAMIALGRADDASALLDEEEITARAHQDDVRLAQVAALRRGRRPHLAARDAEAAAEQRLRIGDLSGALDQLRRARILAEAARSSPTITRPRRRTRNQEPADIGR
jgi:transcriptional regulator with XRE-family HTH domain